MHSSIINTLILFSVVDNLSSQPDLRFNPFDWVAYRQTGAINSVSFSDRYAFIGTQMGGVLRFNINSQRFDEPITAAQGLDNNFVTAVHFSSNGILWVSTSDALQYSLSAEGDWRIIKLSSIGIPNRANIYRIGDDGKDIWIDSDGILYRLDSMTGIVLETIIRQDRTIRWSSGTNNMINDYSNMLFNYTFLDGWMNNLNNILSPDGDYVNITTLAENNFGQMMIGCSDGTFFFGNKSMRMLTPYKFGLASNDVHAIDGKNSFWIAGRSSDLKAGITYFDPSRNIFDHYYFEKIINLDSSPIFSSIDLKKETLFGGEEKIIFFDKKDDMWTEFYLPTGLRRTIVNDMMEIDDDLWIATSNGIMIIDKQTKKSFENEITDLLKNDIVYDLLYYKQTIFIATASGLYIYDNKNEIFYEYESFGYMGKDFSFSPDRFRFTAISRYRNDIYFANQESIIKFNFLNRTWSKFVSADIYGAMEIRDIEVFKNNMFIATMNGLVHYNLKDKIVQVFNYKFLGRINKINIKTSKVWIGTSQGMISYRYK